MIEYRLRPYKYLNKDIIDNLIIHHSTSALRRAGKISPCIKKVEEDQEKIPTLYYIKGDPNPNINDWTVHALVRDISRYVLRSNSINKGTYNLPTPSLMPDESDEVIVIEGEEFPSDFKESLIEWDGITGKKFDQNLIANRYGETLMFSGFIRWYCESDLSKGSELGDGNYVGVKITLRNSREEYPNLRINIYNEDDGSIERTLTWREINGNSFVWICKLSEPLETRRMSIVWKGEDSLENKFLETVLVTPDSEITLEKVESCSI